MPIGDIADKIRGDSSTTKELGDGIVDEDSDSPSNRAGMDDFYRLLLALGEMQMYGHVLNKSLENESGKESDIASETVDDITGNTVEFIGSFDVIKIAKRHGIDWEEDVIGKISDGDVIRK